jgi:hypothetical protein
MQEVVYGQLMVQTFVYPAAGKFVKITNYNVKL